jgi:hypothetical protein
LYFRLNVIPVLVPPLRDRGDDIIRLAEHFVAEFSREYGRRPKTLGPDALAVLRSYLWPGNVRELRNVIERLMIMVPRDVITHADLPFLDVKPGDVRPPDPEEIKPLFDARDAWERSYILGALSVFDGNISRTADALGLERSNLYKKMRGLGIARGKDRRLALYGVRSFEPCFQNLVFRKAAHPHCWQGCSTGPPRAEADQRSRPRQPFAFRLPLDGVEGVAVASSRSSSGSSTPERARDRSEAPPWP